MAVLKILVILVMLAFVRGSSIMRKYHRSADESANPTRNAHNKDKRLQGQKRQAGPQGRLQANVYQFHIETASIDYHDARWKCKDKGDGWDLAVLDTSEKWEKVKKGMKKAGDYWVGIQENTSQRKDKWLWLTGKPIGEERAAGGRLQISPYPTDHCKILSFETGEWHGWIREAKDCNEEAGYICDKS